MDRFGRRYSAVPCFLIFATGMALMPFTEHFGTLLGTAILIGFGNGVGSGIMMTLGADLAPKEGTAEFLGMWRLFGDFGGAAGGHLVVGNVADLWGLGASGFVLAESAISRCFFFFAGTRNVEDATEIRVTRIQASLDSMP